MRENARSRWADVREAETSIGPVGKLACDDQKPQRNRLPDSMRAESNADVSSVHYFFTRLSSMIVTRAIASVARMRRMESGIMHTELRFCVT